MLRQIICLIHTANFQLCLPFELGKGFFPTERYLSAHHHHTLGSFPHTPEAAKCLAVDMKFQRETSSKATAPQLLNKSSRKMPVNINTGSTKCSIIPCPISLRPSGLLSNLSYEALPTLLGVYFFTQVPLRKFKAIKVTPHYQIQRGNSYTSCLLFSHGFWWSPIAP